MKPMKMMQRAQRGFTLIELMIVVAIIGILAAVAIPQYQDYVTRTKLSKAVAAVAPVKLALANYLQENAGGFPAASAWDTLGLGTSGPTTTTEVKLYELDDSGKISITLQNIGGTYNDKKVDFQAVPGASAVTWTVTCDPTGDKNLQKVFGCP